MGIATPIDTETAAPFAERKASAHLYRRALQVMPGGCSRNAILRNPHPLYAASGEGCYITDIDGASWLDFGNNMGSQIHGHAPQMVVEAVLKQLGRGTAFSIGTEAEVQFAEYMCQRLPSVDKIRFVNSGTEAVMCAIKAARAFTGRPKIAKVEGAYHGLYDYAEVSQTANPSNWGPADQPLSVPVSHGTPSSALNEVVVIPFNDTQTALGLLDRHSDSIAGVLIDPVPHRVGLTPAENGFVNALMSWVRRNEALLIFDEVITFRTTFQGAQQLYPVRPDLTALGKMIGGGFPVGAIGGRADVMRVFDPNDRPLRVPHSGTFSANPVTMVAGLAAMKHFDAQAVDRLNMLGERTRMQLRETIRIANSDASVTGAGSMFRIHMKAEPPKSYRGAFMTEQESARLGRLLKNVERNGILLIGSGTGMLSTPMGEAEVDRLSDTMLEALRHV